MSYKGKFRPKNRHKIIGDADNIVFRSLLERSYMKYFDTTDSVVKWASEELRIPYLSPVDKKMHRYFPDFYVEVKKSDGSIDKYIIEIKPDSQLREPKAPTTEKQKKRYVKEYATWLINNAKWDAAKQLCEERGATFKTWSEKTIGMNYNKPLRSKRKTTTTRTKKKA